MCGRLNVTDSPGVQALCEQLDITLWPQDGMRFSRFVRATDRVSVVFEQDDGQRVMKNAIWWLLLDKYNEGQASHFRPSRYTSFNTRYDKLNKPRSAGYHAYRHQRCVIPAAGFGETLQNGKQKIYHDLIVDEQDSLAMGGLYRQWQGYDETGRPFTEYSCSVVTLPPHPSLRSIHTKASPLMLSQHDGSLALWLDRKTTVSQTLDELLRPVLRHHFTATPIDRPSSWQPSGPSFRIPADHN